MVERVWLTLFLLRDDEASAVTNIPSFLGAARSYLARKPCGMTGTTRVTAWSKSTKTYASTAWRPLLRGVDEGRRCLDRAIRLGGVDEVRRCLDGATGLRGVDEEWRCLDGATGLRGVDEGRRCLDGATRLREEGTLASRGSVREVHLRWPILAMQLGEEAVGVYGRGGTVEGRRRRWRNETLVRKETREIDGT